MLPLNTKNLFVLGGLANEYFSGHAAIMLLNHNIFVKSIVIWVLTVNACRSALQNMVNDDPVKNLMSSYYLSQSISTDQCNYRSVAPKPRFFREINHNLGASAQCISEPTTECGK